MKLEIAKDIFTMIDDEDFSKISKYKWRLSRARGYTSDYVTAYVKEKKTSVYLHRFLVNEPIGMVVDHINGDSLDNRKSNLRVCRSQENSRSRKSLQKNNKSGFHGVYKNGNRWRAWIKVDGKGIHLGSFSNLLDAAIRRDEFAKKFHGEFATLNFK